MEYVEQSDSHSDFVEQGSETISSENDITTY